MVGIVVAAVTVATAVSGIQKAMKHVSNINVYGFAIFLIFLLVFSNASFLFNLSTEALGGFAGTFIERILITGESVGTSGRSGGPPSTGSAGWHGHLPLALSWDRSLMDAR